MLLDSLGIIGGADGPTVVFVASGPEVGPLIALAVLVVAILAVVIYFIKRRGKK